MHTKFATKVFILLVSLSLEIGESARLKTCRRGKYFLVEEGRCFLCSRGHFRPEPRHRKRSCIECSQVKPGSNAIILTPCNRESDTVFGCPEGYYESRKYKSDFKCSLCTNCTEINKYEKSACQRHRNSVCCDSKSMIFEGGRCKSILTHPSTEEFPSTKTALSPGTNCTESDLQNEKKASSKRCAFDMIPSENQHDSLKTIIKLLIVLIVLILAVYVGLVIGWLIRRHTHRPKPEIEPMIDLPDT